MKFIFVFLTVLSLAVAKDFQWQQGDIVGQVGSAEQAQMIKNATGSDWTHIGVVIINEKGRVGVLEAVQPVRVVDVDTYIKRSKKFAIMRSKEPLVLDQATLKKGVNFVKANIGKRYDIHFLWGDDKMYCSELVWKAYKNVVGVELCTPRPFEDFNLDDPLVAKYVKMRFGGRRFLPKNHNVVSPGDIMGSDKLKDVTESYLKSR